MKYSNIYEAKTQLSKLVEEAAAGEEIVIGKHGKPMVQLVPYKPRQNKPRLGAYRGKFSIPDNFNEEDEAINRLFYGEDEGQ